MWKKIDGARSYEVNELGQVRSVDRFVRQWTKLTDKKVVKILDMIKNGARNPEIADLFGVKENTISNIRRGHTWKHIPRE